MSPERTTARPGIVERLRDETRAEHDAIEARLDWEARASGRDSYRRWLERLYGYHRVWEPAVADALRDAAFLEPRGKLDLLARDLAALGVGADRLPALPSPDVPPFASAAAAFGSMYVLEGSTLGGQLIARRVRATLGHPAAYHGAYGRRTAEMWRTFRARLASAVAVEDEERAIDAARGTFVGLGAWLS